MGAGAGCGVAAASAALAAEASPVSEFSPQAKESGSRSKILRQVSFFGPTRHAVAQPHVPISIKETSEDCFKETYALGAELMPSTHSGVQVRYAVRISDDAGVVVKVRSKQAFLDDQEEQEWRHNTEFVLNMPRRARVAQLVEVLECESVYYVVMERAPGMDLFDTLSSEAPLSVGEAKEILREVVAGVAELHDSGVIHKDIKLENVVVQRSEAHMDRLRPFSRCSAATPSTTVSETDVASAGTVVKLVDFDTVEPWPPASDIARRVVGSDQYIAYEAYLGRYSPASDVFALGVLAYRLLTGFFPFCPAFFDDEAGEQVVGSRKMNQIQRRLQRAQIDWGAPPFNTDSHALALCSSMLAKNPADRPTAADLLRHPYFQSLHCEDGSSSFSS